jgi:hypothetical protein
VQNRRLRHLQGISIRNLSLSTAHTRPRTATVDDEALPYALKSPSKTLAIREHKQLEHSRSQTNLRPIKESEDGTVAKGKENAVVDGEIKTPTRPGIGRLRRRSTLEWVNASPMARQRKLEDIISTRMVDVFFSLHVADLEEPIYISEVFKRVMNPDFRFFNLSELGPSISRLEGLTIKVWAKSNTMDDYKYLIEMDLSLRSLQFIGKTMANYRQPLPPNSILFHMKDGIYTSFTDMPAPEQPITAMSAPQRALSNQVLPTSSYDALMRLSTLDDCVQDALLTRAKIEKEINDLLQEHKESLETIHNVSEKQQEVSDIEAAIATENKQLAAARRKRDDMKAQLAQNQELMHQGYEGMVKGREEIATETGEIQKTKEALQHITEEAASHRRRCCETLLQIYPIEPIPNKQLHFTIRSLPLSNTEFEGADEEVTAAALGHVAQVVHLLQFYLSVPLPYPVEPRGSTSLVEDPISDTSGSRTYPLFMRGAIKYRFEFGVFLLNKNIEVLSESCGLRFMDPRQTLPNLKYLLYISTAGKGEIPARKAGGIRAFLRADGEGSAVSSRRGSADSGASSLANGKDLGDGKQVAAAKKILVGQLNGSPREGDWGRGNGVVRTGYGMVGQKTLKSSKLRDVS